MGTAIKHPMSDRVKPSFVIFDIRALWSSIDKGILKLGGTPASAPPLFRPGNPPSVGAIP